MMRFLQWINLLGVLALAALCATQWRTNRALNLQNAALDKTQLEQIDQIADRDKTIAGNAADLDEFRKRLTLAESQLQDLQARLSAMTKQRAEIQAERDHLLKERDELKTALSKWMAAVTARDAAIKQAAEQIHKLATDRDEAILQFNDLAKKYNALIATQAGKKPSAPATLPVR